MSSAENLSHSPLYVRTKFVMDGIGRMDDESTHETIVTDTYYTGMDGKEEEEYTSVWLFTTAEERENINICT